MSVDELRGERFRSKYEKQKGLKILVNVNSKMSEDLSLWFAGIGAVAAAVGLIFNGLTNLQQSKSNYFTIFKELEKEYNEIDSRSLELKDYILMNDEELKKEGENFNKTTQFKRDFVQFHEKLAHLYYKKIIPKNILEFFDLTFSHALYYINTSNNREEIKKQVDNLIKWCKDRQIEKKQPYMQSKKPESA
ncbi:MAG: hypothetical protein QXX85_08695 [Candidatus Nitrosotenuis sp.]